MPELVLFVLRVAFLVLLWSLVLAALLVVRRDLSTSGSGRAARRSPRRVAMPARRPRPRAATPSKLAITSGPLAGTSLALGTGPVTIGRADDSTLVVHDDYVSSRHARLVPGADTWLVEDLGSTNGTYLNHQRVTQPTAVPLGVPIRIGKTVLELRK